MQIGAHTNTHTLTPHNGQVDVVRIQPRADCTIDEPSCSRSNKKRRIHMRKGKGYLQ